MASLLSYALTNLSDVKESLGIASSDTSYDNLIIRKINQSTRAIEAYCGRRFKETTYTDEEYDGSGINELVLRQRPVTATQTFSLSIRNTSLNTSDWETIETDLYFVDNNSGVVKLLFHAVGHWNRYKVTYSAGYSSIPEDLAEACASLAAYYVLNADSGSIGILQKKEGMREVRYDNKAVNFSEILNQLGIDGIINSYSNNPILTER